MITLRLTRGDGQKGVSLRLPASLDEEGRAFAKLDEISTDVSSTQIAGVNCYMPNLAQYIKSADINADYDKLKRLAERISGMTEQERQIFSGALDVEDFAQAGIHGVEFAPDYQTAAIPQDCVTVEDANELALCIQQMSKGKMRT